MKTEIKSWHKAAVLGVVFVIGFGAATIQQVVGTGTPGSPSGGIVSIQGVSGGTAIPINGTVTATISGGATEATLSTLNGKFGSIGQRAAIGSTSVVLASDQSLPLPSGAATSALQSTGNTSLASVVTNQTSGGQKTQLVDASGNIQPAGDVVARSIYFRQTDGTNTAPTMDAAARRGFVTHTDGTNSMPTGDAVARGIYHRITDGTSQAAVKAASTAAVASDPALVCAISPNNTPVLPSGASTSSLQSTGNTSIASVVTNQTNGTQQCKQVDASGNVQPSADTVGRSLFSKLTDGTNTAAVKASSTIAATTDPAIVVTMSPNSNTASQSTPTANPYLMAGSDLGNASTNIGTRGRVRVVRTLDDGSLMGPRNLQWGENFDGPTLNTQIWTASTSGGGATVLSGASLQLQASGCATCTTKVSSNIGGNLTPGVPTIWSATFTFQGSTGSDATNEFKMGIYDTSTNQGFGVRYTNAAWNVFAGNGSSFTYASPTNSFSTSGNVDNVEIQAWDGWVDIYFNKRWVHGYSTAGSQSINKQSLPATFELNNTASGINSFANIFDTAFVYVGGNQPPRNFNFPITTNSVTQILNRTPGVITGIAIGDPGSAWIINLYDATSATNQVLQIKPTVHGYMYLNIPVNTGIYVTTTGTTAGYANLTWRPN